MRILPAFRGYTIDERLREFRKVKPGEPMEFIAFDSPEGQKLWQDYHDFLEEKQYLKEEVPVEALKAENEVLGSMLTEALKALRQLGETANKKASEIENGLYDLAEEDRP